MAQSNNVGIVIDVIVKGLQNVDKIGKVLTALANNKAVRAGFSAIIRYFGLISTGAQNLIQNFGKVIAVLGRLGQNTAVQRMFMKIRAVMVLLGEEFKKLQKNTDNTKKSFLGFDLMLGILAIQLRSLAFLIRDLGLNFLRFGQRVFTAVKDIAMGGKEMEESFAKVQAILQEPSQTTESFVALREEIVRVGESSTFAIKEVADLAGVLAQAGLNTDEVKDAIASVVQLAEAGGISAEAAAEIATNAMHIFNLQASELNRVNDVLAATSIASNASVRDLGESLTYVGPLASAFGYSLEEVVGALGLLANSGQRGCYDGETEVLTKDGWVNWKDTTGSETYATVRQSDHTIEWHKALRHIAYKHEGSMYRVNSQTTDLLVTPNHNMYASPTLSKNTKFGLHKAEDLAGKNYRVLNRVNNEATDIEYFELPAVEVNRGKRFLSSGYLAVVDTLPEVKIKMDTWLKFLGAYLAEGHVNIYRRKDGKGSTRKVGVSQQRQSKGFVEFESLLSDFPIKFKYYDSSGQFKTSDNRLYGYLKQFGKARHKYIPDYVFHCSKRQIREFLKFYYLGDGSNLDSKGAFVIYTSSDRMSEDLQRLGTLAGYRVTISDIEPRERTLNGREFKDVKNSYSIKFSEDETRDNPIISRRIFKQRGSKSSFEGFVPYSGMVYCVEVPNNVLIVRRNRKISICGNSVAGAGLGQLFSQLTSRAEKADEILAKYGSSFDAVNPAIHGVVEIMKEFERINFTTTDAVELFGDRSRKTFLALKAQGTETLQFFIDMNREANGLAATIQKVRMDTFAGDMAKLGASVESIRFAIFESIKDNLRATVQWLTKLIHDTRFWVEENEKVVQYVFEMAKLFGSISFILAGIILSASVFTRLTATLVTSWSTILTTLTTFGGMLRGFGASVLTLGIGGGAAGAGLASIGTFLLNIVIPALVVLLPLLAAAAGAIALFAANWDIISKKITEFYNNVLMPFIVGIREGFMKAFYQSILPAMEKWRSLFEEITSKFFEGNLEDSFLKIGELVGEIFGELLALLVQILNVLTQIAKTISDDMGNNLAKFAQLFGLSHLAKSLAEAQKAFGKLIEANYEEQLVNATELVDAAVNELNTTLKETIMYLNYVDELSPKLQNVASKILRFNQLNVNELEDLRATLKSLEDDGGFSTDTIGQNLNMMIQERDKIKEQLQAMREEFDMSQSDQDPATKAEKERELLEKYGVANVNELKKAMGATSAVLKEVEDRIKKLESLKRVAQQFKDIGQFQDQAEFDARVAQLRQEALDAQTGLRGIQDKIREASSLAIGGVDFPDESAKQARLKELREQQDTFQKRIAEKQELINFLMNNANKILFDQNFNLEDLINLREEEIKKLEQDLANEAIKTKMMEEQKEILDAMNEAREEARKEDLLEGADPLSKQNLQDTFKAEDELISLQEAFDKLSDQQAKFVEMGMFPEANALDGELNRIAKAMDRVQAKTNRAKVKRDEQYREDFKDKELDMQLDLAQEAKDTAKELALFEQKFREETEQEIKDKYFDSTTGQERAEASKFRALRDQQLAAELLKIKEKTAKEEDKVADKAKEVHEVQKKGFQLLLEKVKTTRDLIELQRALFKIQTMYDVKALENARRAQNAEQTLQKLMARRAEMTAMGQDTTKLDEVIRRRQETAAIKRGIAERSKKQAGIDSVIGGLGNVNVNNIAQAVSAQLNTIRQMLIGMDQTFAVAATTWIDRFVAAWTGNSGKITDAIRKTLEDAINGISTGALFPPVTPAAPLATASADNKKDKKGNNVTINVESSNPEEIVRMVERTLDKMGIANA